MREIATLSTQIREDITHVYFGNDLLKGTTLFRICQEMGKHFVILSDRNVAPLHGEPILNLMQKQGFYCFPITIEGGEVDKNRRTKERVEDEMYAHRLGSDTSLIAVGGGVVTDVGGFIAATYCRGISYLTVPTSLLGMVDASIGGKNGVNVSGGKNVIGAFHPPVATLIDPSMLDTLPDGEMRSGMVEIIKYGLIHHPTLFADILSNLDKCAAPSQDFLQHLIVESCQVKAEIVATDLRGGGIRNILNFGHTIAHAIETLERYHVSHGKALAIGIVIESFISQKMGHLTEDDWDTIYHLIKRLKLTPALSRKVNIDNMMKTMRADKKAQNGSPRFVILDGIGNVLPFGGDYCTTVSPSILHEALARMIAEFIR